MRTRRGYGWLAGLLLFFLAACAVPAPLPLVATDPAPAPTTARLEPVQPTALVLEAPAASPTPAIIPTVLANSVAVAVPTFSAADPLRFTFPTPVAFNTPENWRPPVRGVPLSIRPQDHFWFTRPIASDSINYPLGSYRYGSDYFGQMNVHAGIDIDAPNGTPILATGSGQVIWTGWGLFNFDPRRTDDPYGIAVAIRHDFGFQGRNLYTLYAHMQAQNNLYVGERVQTGDLLGWVGVTGNTTGPHVHYEVRVGENGYYSTRNPELWIAPYTGWGVLVGQVLDEAGRYVYSQPIDIYDERGRWVATVYTYGDRVARPDENWRENFAISDLPAGRYTLKILLGVSAPPTFLATPTPPPAVEGAASAPELVVPPSAGGELEAIEAVVEIIPGQTNFVLLQAGQGQVPNARPAETNTPAYPTDTATPTLTPTQTFTPSPTNTRRPSATPTVTRTPRPSATPTITRTPRPSPTPSPTRTP